MKRGRLKNIVPLMAVPVNKKRTPVETGALPGVAAPALSDTARDQAVKELPQPQPPVAFGFLKVNPAPIIVVT